MADINESDRRHGWHDSENDNIAYTDELPYDICCVMVHDIRQHCLDRQRVREAISNVCAQVGLSSVAEELFMIELGLDVVNQEDAHE